MNLILYLTLYFLQAQQCMLIFPALGHRQGDGKHKVTLWLHCQFEDSLDTITGLRQTKGKTNNNLKKERIGNEGQRVA